ncbi:hypothetical protein A3SI_13839 [Nitritalea halalkaliphila LW7]|uniref:Uncharacterized protein n=1 Tax=Nitritalea halalkaliphila LW7 TaxID=1189621 RepID=I5C066_9BACT|nr:hypothetical protein A3SI_13839 [Nitritalea halalkaliphila LW7]
MLITLISCFFAASAVQASTQLEKEEKKDAAKVHVSATASENQRLRLLVAPVYPAPYRVRIYDLEGKLLWNEVHSSSPGRLQYYDLSQTSVNGLRVRVTQEKEELFDEKLVWSAETMPAVLAKVDRVQQDRVRLLVQSADKESVKISILEDNRVVFTEMLQDAGQLKRYYDTKALSATATVSVLVESEKGFRQLYAVR